MQTEILLPHTGDVTVLDMAYQQIRPKPPPNLLKEVKEMECVTGGVSFDISHWLFPVLSL